MTPKKFNSGYCSWRTQWGMARSHPERILIFCLHLHAVPILYMSMYYLTKKIFLTVRRKKPTDLIVTLT